MEPTTSLSRTLTPLLLWGLGVGYVISGMYFGWNLGLHEGGTLGLGIATIFILIMYTTFTLTYAELACAIPKAGGAYDYAFRAFGERIGILTGIVQWIEFVFAPPAIALGIGAYFHLLLPNISPLFFAIAVYWLFTALNIRGLKVSATFELVVTCIAVAELLLFAALTLPHFKFENVLINAFPRGWEGAFAAIPYAIWFFLGIEGLANVAEETLEPQKNITKGFSYSMITLALLAILTSLSAVGVGGWEKIVYDEKGNTSDSPLPLALSQITGKSGFFYHSLISIGLFGFIASFHGLLLAAGRVTYELGKTGCFPFWLGEIHPGWRTPHKALWFNLAVGMAALFTGKTGEIIVLAVFGALSLYIISSLSLFALRKKEPDINRPFKVPFYPLIPFVALFASIISMAALIYHNGTLALVFLSIIIILFVMILVVKRLQLQRH
ncbi:MAG: ethanolamine permease [Chitinophagales bacterium]|nr:ethanolamine permease [Chitinophagales bacterium]